MIKEGNRSLFFYVFNKQYSLSILKLFYEKLKKTLKKINKTIDIGFNSSYNMFVSYLERRNKMTELVPKITIKELRARHNLTQEEFAKSVGTSAQTVSAWEKNVLSISPKNMVTICKKYHLKSSDLYGI